MARRRDSLAAPVGRRIGPRSDSGAGGAGRLRVAAIRLPRISNSTDVEALACEPGVDVTWVDDPGSVAAADLVVLPGTRATVADLAWLRERGLAAALTARAERGGPVVAVCGGFQMLARTIDDPVESGRGRVDGLGLFDLTIELAPTRPCARRPAPDPGERPSTVTRSPRACRGVGGGHLDHRRRARRRGRPARPGARHALHGLLACDEFRRSLLAEVAAESGRSDFVVAPDTDFAAARRRQVDLMADLVETHLDLDAVTDLIAHGPTFSTSLIRHHLEPYRPRA